MENRKLVPTERVIIICLTGLFTWLKVNQGINLNVPLFKRSVRSKLKITLEVIKICALSGMCLFSWNFAKFQWASDFLELFFSCFNIEIAYSGFTFCCAWSPSFFEFIWKVSKFQENEHTPGFIEYTDSPFVSTGKDNQSVKTRSYLLFTRLYVRTNIGDIFLGLLQAF